MSAPVSGGNQAVPATRTATGAESSFTTTTVTLPKSGKPGSATVTISAGSVLVQVGTMGNYTAAGVATVNAPVVIDLSMIDEQTSVDIQTEAGGAGVIGIVVSFQ
jgi:hypothetical protein